MTSEGFGEMFEGDSADMCAEKFPLGGRADRLACADPEARTPISASGKHKETALLKVFKKKTSDPEKHIPLVKHSAPLGPVIITLSPIKN